MRALTLALVASLGLTACTGRSAVLPAGSAVSGGFGGANVVAAGGANVVAAGGGNVVSAGGGNLRPGDQSGASGVVSVESLIPSTVALALPASLTASASGYKTLAGRLVLSASIRRSIALYRDSAAVVDGILSAARKSKPKLDTLTTFTTAAHGELTVLVRRQDGVATIAIGRGDQAEGDAQVVGITYDYARQAGTAVFRPQQDAGGLMALATTFDLKARTASVDALADNRKLSAAADPQLTRAHLELDGRETTGRAFRLQLAAAATKSQDATAANTLAVTAHFLKDHSAAAIMGLQSAASGAFTWAPNGDADGSHTFYLSPLGKDWSSQEAPAALQAIVPSDEDIYKPFPTMSGSPSPDDEDVFHFPL